MKDNEMVDVAKHLVSLGRKTKEILPEVIRSNINEPVGVMVDKGQELKIVEGFDFPKRKRLDHEMNYVESFIQYIKEQGNVDTRIFGQIDSSPFKFRGVIDFHGKDKAGWMDHVVHLIIEHSNEFRTWKAIDNRFQFQAPFADFLKDNRMDILTPKAADVLKLVMELEAKSESRYVSKLPSNTGSTIISYKEDVTTTMEVPNEIFLNLPIFKGSPPSEIKCDFKLRIVDGTPKFAIRMIGIERVILDSLKKTTDLIQKETGKTVFI